MLLDYLLLEKKSTDDEDTGLDDDMDMGDDTGDDDPASHDTTGDSTEDDPSSDDDTSDIDDTTDDSSSDDDMGDMGDDSSDDSSDDGMGDDSSGDDTSADDSGDDMGEDSEENTDKIQTIINKLKNKKLLESYLDLHKIIKGLIVQLTDYPKRTKKEIDILQDIVNDMNIIEKTVHDYIIYRYVDSEYEQNLFFFYKFQNYVKINMEIIKKIKEITSNQ